MDVSNVQDIYKFCGLGDAETVEMLQQFRLLPSNKICPEPSCEHYCTIVKRDTYYLKHCFWCSKCRGECYRLTDNTFFANLPDISLLPKTVVYILWLWACDFRTSGAGKFIGVPRNTIYRLYLSFRDICSWKFLNNPELLSIGGPDHLVQMIMKRKSGVGRTAPMNRKWIVGMYSATEKRGIAFYVDQQNSETLTGLVLKHVKPGTEIWTDRWEGYSSLNNLEGVSPYTHKAVNQRKSLVEGYWLTMNKYFRRIGVTSSTLSPTHLDQFMWMTMFGKTHITRFNHILEHIAERYPV